MNHIAGRIRSLRRIQKRTLKDIASRCGFTVSLLSKIESGKTSPPVATLSKIADALGVSLAELVDPGHGSSTVHIASSDNHNLSTTDKGYLFKILASERSGKLMQPFIFEAEKGKISAGPMTHNGEEFVYVLEGQMRYRVGHATYTLGPQDGLYFNAEDEHDLEPLSDKVRYLAVFAER